MPYLLDTSVFVSATNDYYRPTICPGFWNWLEHGNNDGTVYSVGAVLGELTVRDDPLARWAARLGKKMFLEPDPLVQRAHSRVRAWAAGRRYRDTAVDAFLEGADSFLVAHAMVHGHAVVTMEKPAKMAKKRIPIPSACEAFDVEWYRPFDMLERAGAQFVLAGS